MANLSATETRIIEDTFDSGSGYVMDLTNSTFSSLFRRDVGVEIYSENYASYGNSKGKRLRSFLEQAPDQLIVKALKSLWAYRVNIKWSVSWRTAEEETVISEKFCTLLQKVESGNLERAKLPNVTLWLVDVSQQIRKIAALASNAAIEILKQGQTKASGANKNKLEEHYSMLIKLLPVDFPQSRINEMARHIHFCDEDDLNEIALVDGPDVMEKAERYATAYIAQNEDEFDARNLVDELFRRKLNAAIDSEDQDYHGLVLQCSVILAERFKARTGMTDDMSAIGKAFSPKNPILMVPTDLDSETNRNYQQGAMYLFQGYRTFFRNTHAHGVTDTDKHLALQALMLFSLLANILSNARRVDEGGS